MNASGEGTTPVHFPIPAKEPLHLELQEKKTAKIECRTLTMD